jgi:hypothetical protein
MVHIRLAFSRIPVILVVHRPMRLASREQDKQDFLQRAARDLEAARLQSAAPAPLRLQWKLASVHDQTSAQQYLGTLPLTESIMLYLVEDGHIRTRNGAYECVACAHLSSPNSLMP